jgi:hypothetical protein
LTSTLSCSKLSPSAAVSDYIQVHNAGRRKEAASALAIQQIGFTATKLHDHRAASFKKGEVVMRKVVFQPSVMGTALAPGGGLGVALTSTESRPRVHGGEFVSGREGLEREVANRRLDPLVEGGRYSEKGASIVRHPAVGPNRGIVNQGPASGTTAAAGWSEFNRHKTTVFNRKIGDGDEKSPP